jgi:hypothetical protein
MFINELKSYVYSKTLWDNLINVATLPSENKWKRGLVVIIIVVDHHHFVVLDQKRENHNFSP